MFLMMKTFSLNATLILISVIMMSQASSWLMIWILMEMNMIGMTVQLMSESKKESAILFIIFQTLPAMSMLTYLVANNMSMEAPSSPEAMGIMLGAMACKMGMFPFQNWVLKMSSSISWMNNFIMMTWQKIIPLMILTMMSWKMIMMLVMITSMMMMTFSLLAMMSMKCFLMSSSLIHLSWMTMGMSACYWVTLSYITIYSVILSMVIMKMKKKSKKLMTDQMWKSISEMSVVMMSLAGIPPMAGFMAKSIALLAMAQQMKSKKTIIIMLIMASLSFLAYMQMMYKSILLTSSSHKEKKTFKQMGESKKALTINTAPPCLYYA